MAKEPLKNASISTAQVKAQAEQVANLFSQLSDEVFSNFLNKLTKNIDTVTQKNVMQWQMEKLSEFGALNDENKATIDKYIKAAAPQLTKLIVDNGQKIYNDTLKNLPDDKNATSNVKARLTALVQQTMGQITNLTNQTMLNTQLASGTMSKTAFGQYQEAINKAAADIVTGNKTSQQAIEGAVSAWINTGTVGYLTDSAGKKWTLDNYARTNLTTTTFRTYNQMRTQPAADNGIHLFYMSEHDAPREACEDIQGGIVYDPRTGDMTDEEAEVGAPDLSDYGLGDPGGTFGINCHHYLTPYVVGVNVDPSSEEDAEDEESELNSDDDDYGSDD